MFAKILNLRLKEFGIHYGWVMAVMAFLTTISSSAAVSTPQVLIIPLTESFGWNISDVTSASALMFIILASLAPFGGALMLRIGLPNVIIISSILIISGLLICISVSEKWHLLLGIGVCLGSASGILGLSLAATVATRWFNKKRGLVVGILTSGFAAGQLTFIPFMAWITTQYDWRYCVLPPLFGSIACAILFFLFGKNWPSDLDLPPLGDSDIQKPPPLPKENPVTLSFQNLFLGLRHPAFWILAITFFICGLTSNGLILQHFIPFCGDNNIGIVMASSYLAIMGIFNFLGTMGSGWLSDRYDNYILLGIYYMFRGISLIYLPYSNLDFLSLTIWAIFFGLDFIATVPPTVKLTSKYFGTIQGPVLFGWIFSAHQFGAAFAAYGAGVARDSLLTYLPVFVWAGFASFMATILILIFKKINFQLTV